MPYLCAICYPSLLIIPFSLCHLILLRIGIIICIILIIIKLKCNTVFVQSKVYEGCMAKMLKSFSRQMHFKCSRCQGGQAENMNFKYVCALLNITFILMPFDPYGRTVCTDANDKKHHCVYCTTQLSM